MKQITLAICAAALTLPAREAASNNGGTPLLTAVRDPRKVALLLEAGANGNGSRGTCRFGGSGREAREDHRPA